MRGIMDPGKLRDCLVRLPNENDKEFTIRITSLISKGLVRINWLKCDIDEYYLRIPLWENYILFILSFLPGSSTFRRYHFCNYAKTIERGVANCADSCIILSYALKNNGVRSRIVAFSHHVLVEAMVDSKDDAWWVFDPNLGVSLPHSAKALMKDPGLISQYYINAGCDMGRIEDIKKILTGKPEIFSDYFAFSPKRAIFEAATYVMIWLIPAILIILSAAIFKSI